jgi:very-short-patch-repair endonuclease
MLKIMASVKQAWINKYGEREGLRMWNDHKSKFGKTKDELRIKYGDDYVKNLSKKKSTFNLQYYIDKYGDIDGKLRWDAVVSKKLKTQKDNFRDKKWKNGRTLEEYQERHGVDVGYTKWSERNRIQSYKVSRQRYIDEYGEIYGREICAKIKDNISLESFVNRYGADAGRIKYEENCKKYAITLDRMVSKYGEIDGTVKYTEWLSAITKPLEFNGVSKSSQTLFWQIYNHLPDNMKSDVYFYELNEEYKFYEHTDNLIKLHRVDFKFKHKIIEFDCEYWHDTYRDMKRDLFLKSHNYDVLRVKYENYMKNKSVVIGQCIKFLYE